MIAFWFDREAQQGQPCRPFERASDIAWADAILVMEDKHRRRILTNFPNESKFKPVHVLDIPDDYPFMHDELVELLKSAAEPIIAAMETS